jgi:hypothetical protein
MYYGNGGLTSEKDESPWCFRAPRPKWASGFNINDLPNDVRKRYEDSL